MTKQTPERPSSVTPERDLDEELEWWGNTPALYWAMNGPSGAPGPLEWLNGKVSGNTLEFFHKWWRETVGTADVESHPLVWLPEWKRDFMVGRHGAGSEPEVPGAYPAVERLHNLGVRLVPLLNEITETRLTLEHRKQLRSAIHSAENRDRDAQILEEAAAVLDKWRPVLSRHTPTINITLPGKKGWIKQQKAYPDSFGLRWTANALRRMGPGKRHRPAEIEILQCAFRLKEMITEQIGTPRIREIGELLHAAFPEDFHPHDVVEATTKLLQRAAQMAKLRERK
jgi:hypothetical protein